MKTLKIIGLLNRNVAKVIGPRGCCQTGLERPCI